MGHIETAYYMVILTQQKPQAQMCQKTELEVTFLPKDPSTAWETLQLSFLEEFVLFITGQSGAGIM